MTIHQSDTARRKDSPTTPAQAGTLSRKVFSVDLSAGYTGGDPIELGYHPPMARLTNVTLVGVGLGALTAALGYMSGKFGDPDDARTVGTEMFSAQSVNDTEASMTQANILGLTVDEYTQRPIGAELSGNVVAGSGKKLHLIVEYTY